MLCECGCPIGIAVYKGGESFIEMIEFAQSTLEVLYINSRKQISNIKYRD